VPNRASTAAILLETVMVVAVAAAFAFLANAMSPRGLNLARNYFPKAAPTAQATPKVSASAATQAPTPATPAVSSPTNAPAENSEIEETDQRIKDKGLQPVERAEMERIYNSPRYQQGYVIFIDARNPDFYADSHIPGAYPLDFYHPAKDLAEDLTPCQNAEQVIVYCTGGECEDAESTAIMLRDDAHIPTKKIFVYGGGFDDWSGHHLPLERGARNSGLPPEANK
jgi:rhodanese-related sulfurtransferase